MSAVLSLLQSRLLRPVFIALGIALLVQVIVAVALTRSTVTALEADLANRLGVDSQHLSSELELASSEVTSSLDALSASTRQRLSVGLSTRLKEEQAQLRATLEKDLRESATDMAELLAAVAPRAMWDNDTPTLSEFARRAQRNPNVLFVVYDDAAGEHLTRYMNRDNPLVKALLAKGEGERAMDKVLNAAKNDPSVYYVEASISPNGVEIGKVRMGVSTATVEENLAALDKRFATLITSGEQLVSDSLASASKDSSTALRTRLQSAQAAGVAMTGNTRVAVQEAAETLRWRIGMGLALVGLGVLLLLAVVLGRRVVSKLHLLIAALNDLAAGEGDLTKRVKLDSNDEIGDMSAAVNRFIDKLQPIVREAGEVAQRTGVEIGVMSQRNAGADAAAELQRDEVAASLKALGQMADEAQSESHAMQAALRQVIDIKQATDENTRTSNQVGGLIEALAGQVETGAQVIERLAQQSQQIEVVLEVIHGIAEQTNLLALNAAIEAARAGETGRGFAVVADEVRALASKTQSSTGDIQEHIIALQRGAKEAVAAIGIAGRQAKEGLEVLRDSAKRQQTVQASVEQVHAAIGLATQAAVHQAEGAQAVRGRVEVIHAQAEKAAKAVVETTASGKVLNGLAAQLKASLGQFRA
ncbi:MULTISPECIES: methyl-accepting chemotaxis protein [Pseudomonas syringae group]|uniref:Methyl-accepting chemotaxis protein n=4 Tax=Pseudomonas syringae group TaxID=136849 RepID=A0AAD0M4W4_9PSED|nr:MULTISPECIES: methyl-accepting chemotaxis protein [Pseudomonas syringae group]NAS95473.1 methyl-accepting chemotaxis protein [Pseudomonas syringae pv. actinidifoliorum]AVB22260.1 methyl-accepting chemotaxis protein [Pseudomonas avellanae]EGH07928.1 methyl-accepting chemotaxis protein [Pseudomonas amygdali pv. morsprunorum str. M302280]KWS65698.1 chemotaxis protein [Pseudomonas amygdali pv. morsprunorum]NAT62142.1 methyl-accepting chemotaxis protein [Pseudomonas syringae pv. actinidifoliorum